MIRIYHPLDKSYVANIWYQAGRAEYTYLPLFQALDPAWAEEIFATEIVAKCTIWVDDRDDVLRGFIAMDNSNKSYIDRLYVHPKHQGIGVGYQLLCHAKRLCPTGLELHTHQQNTRARRLYESLGFVAVSFGTSPPPESVPDLEYHWRPSHD